MRSTPLPYALTAVLLAFFLTADVSAQIRFAGTKNGLRVNEKIIDSNNLHESLHEVVEILRTQSGSESFAAYTTGGFPMRARINGIVYEVWRDRIVESCDARKADHEIQVQPDPSDIIKESYSYQRALTASGPQLGLPLLVSSFKGDGQQTDIFVNYGTPLDSIHDRSDGMIADYSIISTFVITDQGDTLVERTRNFNYSNMVKVFPDQDLWVDTQQMQVSSDEHDLMVVQKADGQTMDMRHRYIKVPDYGRAGLMLSSVMHAYSIEQTENGVPPSTNEIVRRGFSILPAARNVYSTEWPIYLYFEVYGLALNALGRTDYDVEITLEPKNADRRVRRLFRRNRDRGREGVSVSYRGNGAEPEESLYQILDVSDQKTGFYTLTVSVRDNETGEESGRIQDLFLRRWGLSCSE